MTTNQMGSVRSDTSTQGRGGSFEGQGSPGGAERGQAGTEGTREVMGLARGQLMGQLEGQKSRLASSLTAVSDVLEESGQRFRDENHTGMADYPGAAADQIRRLATQLETSDLNDIMRQAENVARDRPALFLGGAFALGMIGARFLRSSPPNGGRRSSMGSSGAPYRSQNYGDPNRLGSGVGASTLGTTDTSSAGAGGTGASGTQGLRSTEAMR